MAEPLIADQSLIEDSLLQPQCWPLDTDPAAVRDIVRRFSERLGSEREALLQLLIRVNCRLGWIPPAAVEEICRILPVSCADIRGLIEFYSFLNDQFRGQYQILLSGNITDDFAGQRQNFQMLSELLSIPSHGVRADGLVSVDFTSCTGLCDQGPAALINGHPLTRLTPARIREIAARIESRSAFSDWPAHWFEISDSIVHPGPLLNRALTPGSSLDRWSSRSPAELIEEIRLSSLRGRGGAGFSSWQKFSAVAARAPDSDCFLVCNADEGEPGTFKDRVLLSRHFEQVVEGMTLAALALGARHGVVYLRGEYAFLLPQLSHRLTQRRKQGLLGTDIKGRSGFDFDIHLQLGAGAYICGEETALIESLEGKRGVPRIRPPFPASSGYRQKPTLLSNVETFACITEIALSGGKAFAREGTAESAGNRLHSISGDCPRAGVYELTWGVSVAEVLSLCGADDAQAVQIGGPSGTLLLPDQFDRTLAFEDVPTGGSFMVIGRQRDLAAITVSFTEFFAHESCGFCAPCRAGCQQLVKLGRKLSRRPLRADEARQLTELSALMRNASHCGLGKTAPQPLQQLQDAGRIPVARPDYRSSIELKDAFSENRRLRERP